MLNRVFLNVARLHLNDEELSGYLEGKTDFFTNSRVEAHLALCGFCRDEIQMVKEVLQDRPGELDVEIARQIKKLLSFIPIRQSAREVKQNGSIVPRIIVGRLDFQYAATGIHGKTISDWAELKFSEDKQCVWTYREDNQQNLIFKFTVFSPLPKLIRLEAAGHTWQATLEPEGNDRIAEVIILYEERARLQSGDDIQIELINL